ncbi:hypothetical protein DKT77_10740 [Meridianimarinicoccus roseus]|uniref:Group 4 capsule polysaccharide lipoprotein gfcB, YjbF n=1 Tax=Meridianimarinicoccus roseus TaxID=2072018 RepID=A0A2V2LB74_9RHOB|nr:YjbF family lipoprotein [Meridianimarinicoccus roseus]PWR02648.1 hypothetical protein DKT77_10740 [Meridianimarinicoccus roseus]
MRHSGILAALVAACTLAACGNSDEAADRRATFQAGLAALNREEPDGSVIAAERAYIPVALQNTDAPLVLVEQPKFDLAAFFALAAVNGPVASYGSSAQATISLNGPVLVATRAFGNDLMSSDVGPLPDLLAAREPGQYRRQLRYLDSEEQVSSFTVDCDLRPDPDRAQTFTEYCGSAGMEFRNSYVFGRDGRVETSVQWHGPENGYLTVRRLR